METSFKAQKPFGIFCFSSSIMKLVIKLAILLTGSSLFFTLNLIRQNNIRNYWEYVLLSKHQLLNDKAPATGNLS